MVVMLVLQSLATVRVLRPRARVAASTPLMSTHPMLTQCRVQRSISSKA